VFLVALTGAKNDILSKKLDIKSVECDFVIPQKKVFKNESLRISRP